MYTEKQIYNQVKSKQMDIHVQKAMIHILEVRTKDKATAQKAIDNAKITKLFVKQLTTQSNNELCKSILSNIEKKDFDTRMDIYSALNLLSLKQYCLYRLLSLHFIGGYKKYEIATMMNFKRADFNKYLHMAVKMFFSYYDEVVVL